MITLASYSKQNLNLVHSKYGKDNLLFITHPEIERGELKTIINTISCLQVLTAIYATSLLHSEH